MALSQEEKDALADHYRNVDLYDPTKDPKQEVSTFEPKGMFGGGSMGAFCDGGTAGYADGGSVGGSVAETEFPTSRELMRMPPTHKGMVDGVERHSGGGPEGFDDGGSVPGLDLSGLEPGAAPADDFSGPSISGDTDTVKAAPPSPVLAGLINEISRPPAAPAPAAAAPALPQAPPPAPRMAAAPTLPLPGSSAPPAQPQAAPATPGKLGPSEYDELIKALQPSLGARIGQGAFSGLGGLADAIETGVARGSSPGFQKGIDERAQNQRQNLINALREKYETGFKGKELAQGQERIGQEGQRIKQEGEHNKATEAQSAAMLKFDQDREKINSDLEAGKITLDQAKAQMEAAQKGAGLFNAIGRKLGYGPPLPPAPGQPAAAKIPTVRTKAEYASLPPGTHYQDVNGKQGIKK